jgi:hypothetical protein
MLSASGDLPRPASAVRPARHHGSWVPQGGRRLLALLVTLQGMAPTWATAQTPAPAILTIPGSVRGAGLHGAGAALVGDAGSVFSNPVGLATLRHIGLEGTYGSMPFNGRLATGAIGWRLAQFDVGGGIAYATGDSVPGFGLSRGSAGRPYEALGVGSLVYRFGLFAVGGSIKELRRCSEGTEERGRSGDLGVALAFFDIMAMGFAVQNVGGNWYPQSTIAMPRLTRWGFTMNYSDPEETFRLMSTVEVQWPEGAASRWILGGEAGAVVYGVGVLGRAAFKTRTVTGEPAFTVGASLALSRLRLDYAYEAQQQIGPPEHRLGLRLTL